MALFLLGAEAPAQNYEQVPVKVSSDKVRRDGNVYYAHAVQERQTLFSIAKAYGVTVDEIVAANPEQNLRQEGLKKGAVILIPVSSSETAPAAAAGDEASDDGNYTIHIVKWYEDLDSIAGKYGVSAEAIMKANNLTSKKLAKRARLRIPLGDKASGEEKQPVETEQPEEGQEDSGEKTLADKIEEEADDLFGFMRRKEKVQFSLLLPLGASGTPSVPNMDFYSGALMALRDLGDDGISAQVKVIDVAGKNVSASDIAGSDFVIGPVSVKGLSQTLSVDSWNIPVISPLDQKAASLTDSCRHFIQAPSSYEAQYTDLVSWLGSDVSAGDKVLMIHDNSGKGNASISLTDALLREKRIPFETLAYSVQQGRSISSRLEGMLGSGTTRVILVSDDEAFVNDVVRNLDLMVYRGKKVILYGTSRVRSFKTIGVENLHLLDTRLSVSYNIDYTNREVDRFVRSYRALFNAEPSQFAFQGYDIVSYFVRSCYEGGRNWMSDLGRMSKKSLLQGDFLFSRNGDGGFLNTGVRRIIYSPDFRIIKAY